MRGDFRAGNNPEVTRRTAWERVRWKVSDVLLEESKFVA